MRKIMNTLGKTHLMNTNLIGKQTNKSEKILLVKKEYMKNSSYQIRNQIFHPEIARCIVLKPT